MNNEMMNNLVELTAREAEEVSGGIAVPAYQSYVLHAQFGTAEVAIVTTGPV